MDLLKAPTNVPLETLVAFTYDGSLVLEEFDNAEDLILLASPSKRIVYDNSDGFATILYIVELTVDWVVFIRITPSEDNLQTGEDDLLFILESLEFDLEAASTPFVRDLDEYDFGDITLANDYQSSDYNLSLSYSDDWDLVNTNEAINSATSTAYLLRFEQESVSISISVYDVTDTELNAPPDRDTPDEVLLPLRQSDEGRVEQFLIDEYEAVSIEIQDDNVFTQTITVALNDDWLAQASMSASSEEELDNVESVVVATLASIELVVGSSYITSPVLNVALPEAWEVDFINFENEEYRFSMITTPNNTLAVIMIVIVNIEELGIAEAIDNVGFEAVSRDFFPNRSTNDIRLGEYEVVQADMFEVLNESYVISSLIRLDKNWLFVAYAISGNEDVTESLQEDLNTIIETMEITLPEED
ncbi:MAG: hypothetical protein Phog2KO_49830 [Phototrophicaceae bacterium]